MKLVKKDELQLWKTIQIKLLQEQQTNINFRFRNTEIQRRNSRAHEHSSKDHIAANKISHCSITSIQHLCGQIPIRSAIHKELGANFQENARNRDCVPTISPPSSASETLCARTFWPSFIYTGAQSTAQLLRSSAAFARHRFSRLFQTERFRQNSSPTLSHRFASLCPFQVSPARN